MDSPAIVPLAEPLHLAAGQGLTFTCHDDNGTDQELVHGAGQSQEMCAATSLRPPEGPAVRDPAEPRGVVHTEGKAEPLFDTTDLGGPF